MPTQRRRLGLTFKPTMTGGERGQSLLEHASLIAVVCLVIVGMQVYTKRAIQGRLKEGYELIGQRADQAARGRLKADDQKAEAEPGAVTPLFSPRWSNTTVTATFHDRSRQTLSPAGERVSTLLDHETLKAGGSVDDFSNKRLTEEKLFE